MLGISSHRRGIGWNRNFQNTDIDGISGHKCGTGWKRFFKVMGYIVPVGTGRNKIGCKLVL